VQLRVQFLDASGTIIREMHTDAWNVAGAIALVKEMEWPACAVRMVILNEAGAEVQVEPGTTVAAQGVATCHVKPTLTLVRGLETKQESRRKRTSRPRHAPNSARAQRRWTLS
jgi:hypothetical protein